MRTRRKHDATDEAIRLVASAVQWEDQVADSLRSYKQDDLLADVCSAREAAFHLREVTRELANQVSSLADAEVAMRVGRARS